MVKGWIKSTNRAGGMGLGDLKLIDGFLAELRQPENSHDSWPRASGMASIWLPLRTRISRLVSWNTAPGMTVRLSPERSSDEALDCLASAILWSASCEG